MFLVPAPLRHRVYEILRFVGAKSEAWLCGKCSNFGVFGPTEMAF